MSQGTVMEIAQNAMMTMLYVSAPILILGLIVGLAVSIFQATTQIQEQSLQYVPKILVVVGSIMVFGSWMLTTLVEYTTNLYANMNNLIR